MADPYKLEIAADLAPGEYDLLAGMYQPSTGERLPLLSQEGQLAGDSISLGWVEIGEP